MPSLHHYLHFTGNAEEAFNFYKSVFGGEFLSVMRYKDGPKNEHISANDAEKIMHITLPIGNGDRMMGSDVPESMKEGSKMGTNYFISIATESKEEADKIYNGLSAGGRIEMPLGDTFWGSYFGMFADKFGVQWMISFNYEQ